ncbi:MULTISPECIES: Imm51 family immunity protein [unclassified Streptomyces]|uniref:Imm51 family immunity protein n=1 Tax=unclassified Streptomyces TaxID=2593676 RepID=UPI00382B0F3A
MSEPSALAPFHLDEGRESEPSHCLYLFEIDMEQVADVFEGHNAESHGHGWEGLAESLVRSRLPESVDKLHCRTFHLLRGNDPGRGA